MDNSRDDSERKQAEEKVRLQALLLDAVGQAVIATDLDSRIVYWNQTAEELYGWSAEEATGRSLRELVVSEEFGKRAEEIGAELKAGRSWSGEVEVWRKDGTSLAVLGTATPVYDDRRDLVGTISVSMDITDRKRMEQQLYHQALHDPLTGLANRSLLEDRLGQALARAQRREGQVAVLYMDLDNFKIVNDSLGHEAGDRILVAVSERLKSSLRPEDTLVRFGGDEFVVVLENVMDLGVPVRVVDRISEKLQDPFVLDGQEIFITTSIGIALNTSGQESPEELLRNADTAMYRAKEESGVSYQLFESSMHEQALRSLRMESDLRRAIEREELKIYYQPKVSLETGKVMDMEALVRWEHPEWGLLLPSEFIPLAEHTGLIVPLGRWVLKEVCLQAKKWQEESPQSPLSTQVNLSARQIQHRKLVQTIEQILEETGLEGRYLTLDVPETVLIEAVNEGASNLERLRGLGIRLAVDDFGMVYSSLSYLKRLPMDILKIDKSLVQGLGEDPKDTAIVQVVIEVGHTLGMKVVAEGVESAEQAMLLREMGCDLGQGLYFAEPLPSGEASERLVR
jgi:diguanylate cyclase (GGDEF)-like protein/PAS domain S-box-containing protein